MGESDSFYITTPIYYVNDRPHIGHLYSTTVADVIARMHRLRGEDVFFLTGTDEHADKVEDAARERGISTREWADQNAAAFRDTFAAFGISNDDFIRTSEERHKDFVPRIIQALVDSGDIYRGEYEGWYDASQEEYVTENRAAESDHKSPITGKPLVRRTEENFFFRLSAYSDALEALLGEQPDFVQPPARRNEVLGRIREGLADVPISRNGDSEWGIRFPGESGHLVYVWIDALINYATAIEPEERRHFWPADLHFIAKDILWFHAVIWPAMLLALRKTKTFPWLELPRCVYAHSFWIREGQKMSKSLGNFVDLEELEEVRSTFGLDALRYFLATQGPLGTVDSDFARSRLVEVYNTDLANTVGNAWNRIVNMTGRYLGGRFEDVATNGPLRERVEALLAQPEGGPLGLGAIERGLELVRLIDAYIEETRPFKLAKEEDQQAKVAEILYECAETYRLASLQLWPVLTEKMEDVWSRMGLAEYGEALQDRGRGRFAEWSKWGGLAAGSELQKGAPLYPRHEVAEEG